MTNLAIKDARVQHLVPSNPQIHDGNALARLLHGRLPLALNHRIHHLLRGLPGQHLLRLVWPKHARAHSRRHQRLDVAQHKDVRRLPQAQPDNGADCAKQRRKVARHQRRHLHRSSTPTTAATTITAVSAAAGALAQQGGKVAEDLHVGGGGTGGDRRAERALPDGEQGTALRGAGAAADGADDGGVELVVERGDGVRVAVGGEDEGESGRGEGGEGEREERRKGGVSRGVREEGLEAAGEGKGADGQRRVGEEQEEVLRECPCEGCTYEESAMARELARRMPGTYMGRLVVFGRVELVTAAEAHIGPWRLGADCAPPAAGLLAGRLHVRGRLGRRRLGRETPCATGPCAKLK